MNIKELQERYQIASRSAFYSRLKALDITLDKDSDGVAFATEPQIQQLDQLHEHLKNGGTLKNFSPTTKVSVLSQQDSTLVSNLQKKDEAVLSSQDSVRSSQYNQLELLDDLLDVGYAIASRFKSPIEHWKELIYAVEHELILSTHEVQQLTGSKPSGKIWKRGSFQFVRSGKIGAQTAWRVLKVEITP